MKNSFPRSAALLALVATLVPLGASAQHRAAATPRAVTPTPAPRAATAPRSTATTTTTTTTTTTMTTGAATGAHRGATAPTTARRARAVAPRPCVGPVVTVVRESGGGHWTGALTDCRGRPTVHALAALSLLAAAREVSGEPDVTPVVRALRRFGPAAGWDLADEPGARPAASPCPPGQEPDPDARASASARRRGHNATPARAACRAIALARDPHTRDPLIVLDGRVRVLHPRLIQLLARVAEHFPNRRVEIISGYRPSRNPQAGSRHAHARAMDFRLEGVRRETLRDFAQTLPDAGVGYYPNSVFVHMDVRDPSEGSARWTDYSAPREHPRYGAWPPRSRDVRSEARHVAGQTRRTVDAVREAMDDGAEEQGSRDATPPAAPAQPAQPAAPTAPAQPAPPAVPPPPPSAP